MGAVNLQVSKKYVAVIKGSYGMLSVCLVES